MNLRSITLPCLMLAWGIAVAFAQDVPTEVQMPGTQPLEIGNLESPDKCDNCHGGYNPATEPAHNWRGSMMAHAGRDPIFWATLAVTEQDFPGAGDLCLRCHSTSGWLAGRSTPTDGSGLASGDGDGVECDYCHKLTNPDDSEHLGVQNAPFLANDEGTPPEGYYGSGMSSVWDGADKLGPYDNADARHQFMPSSFHRDRRFCGTCHDVSNPVTGDLAHNHGQPKTSDTVIASGVPGSDVSLKAAFNNLPHTYGVVERTFSEFLSGAISGIAVDDYPAWSEREDFPAGGALEAIWKAATDGGTRSANYKNPSELRYYSCQSCHMRPVTGQGANKRGVPVRTDLPLHDMTGGNYWMPYAIDYLDKQGQLLLGGGLSESQRQAMFDGAARSIEQLQLAATVTAKSEGERVEVKVVNHSGHKLITGYPEGRRMWLNVRWLDEFGNLAGEEGAYGDVGVTLRGEPLTIRTLLNPEQALVFEASMGMTAQWAQQLLALGFPAELPLSYALGDGAVEHTLGELASGKLGSSVETFHFALNNTVVSDNRIPPYGMAYDTAFERNVLPVPVEQYGAPSAGGVFDHYFEHEFTPPSGAVSAQIRLMYQPTSWAYIQFLALANKGDNPFLGQAGDRLLEAWLKTGMAEPLVMAETTWGSPGQVCDVPMPTIGTADAGDKQVTIRWQALDPAVDGYALYYDQSGKTLWVADSACTSGACSLVDSGLSNGVAYCYVLTAWDGECESAASVKVCATPQPPGQQQYAGLDALESGRWLSSGKGKNATTTWESTSTFLQGDTAVFRGRIVDAIGTPMTGASFGVLIDGPDAATLTSTSSQSGGWAEVSWQIKSPNRKGQGGTAPGTYTVSVTGVSAGGHTWDGRTVPVDITVTGR